MEKIGNYDCVEIEPGTELEQSVTRQTIGEVVYSCAGLIHTLDSKRQEELQEAHKQICVMALDAISDVVDTDSEDAIWERTALIGMVGASLCSTFQDAINYIKFQVELANMECGES